VAILGNSGVQAGQVEEVIDDAVRGADGQGQMTVAAQ
jgi:hypothetical protein